MHLTTFNTQANLLSSAFLVQVMLVLLKHSQLQAEL